YANRIVARLQAQVESFVEQHCDAAAHLAGSLRARARDHRCQTIEGVDGRRGEIDVDLGEPERLEAPAAAIVLEGVADLRAGADPPEGDGLRRYEGVVAVGIGVLRLAAPRREDARLEAPVAVVPDAAERAAEEDTQRVE